MNANERDRQQIRDASDRLFAGKPLRSNGTLHVTTLAKEAGMKRWMLTHRHTDLAAEFVSRRDLLGSPKPPAERALRDKNADLERRLKRTRLNLLRALAGKQRYARMVQVLTMENAQLAERLRSLEPRPTLLRGEPERPGA